jgi:hypothetical protein
MSGLLNRTFFFDRVRLHPFGGPLNQVQVAGLNALLDYWDASHAQDDDRWLAYILGTAFHEVDRKMKPIYEYGTKSYFMHNYDKSFNPAKAAELGNTVVGDGYTFRGRGFVQLTGRRNYADWTTRLGIDLVNDPDRVLELAVATRIIFEGMILGTFTGKKLGHYFTTNPDHADWVQARRVVNGTNKANLIAGYGKDFYAAISYTV